MYTYPHLPQAGQPHLLCVPLLRACRRLYEVGLRQGAGYASFVLGGHVACYTSKVHAPRYAPA